MDFTTIFWIVYGIIAVAVGYTIGRWIWQDGLGAPDSYDRVEPRSWGWTLAGILGFGVGWPFTFLFMFIGGFAEWAKESHRANFFKRTGDRLFGKPDSGRE